MPFVLFFLFPLLLQAQDLTRADVKIRHDLKVDIHPDENRFTAEDIITLPENYPPAFRFRLHRGLNPSSPTKDVAVTKDAGDVLNAVCDSFSITLPAGVKTFVIDFGGVINHAVEKYGKDQARGYSHTPGIISTEGVYLAGSSFWYPVIDNALVTFNLAVELPEAWSAVSQGERKLNEKSVSGAKVLWDSPDPQDEIFLIASKFHEYTLQEDGLLSMVFLHKPENELAGKYLKATIRYINMYENLIGPYPYKKFALVENFWESGLGMPSFTLLGSTVIRLPFIIDSSYPHEILHNWWGNSVLPEYDKGNWSEGLTAYLADHLLKEQKGEGAEYRQTTLQKYADYVISGRDFPLTEFRSRHSPSSEAIGYGKSLMFFHMLRSELGDSVFTEGLRDFYKKNKFRYANFNNLRQSYELVSRKDLEGFFKQWIEEQGAPQLVITKVQARRDNESYILSLDIEQAQTGKSYNLRIPIAITLEGHEQAYQTVVSMDRKNIDIQIPLNARPMRVDVDPEFDLFRRLDRNEIPPAISQALGAKRMLMILPSAADDKLLEAYKSCAKSLSKVGPDEVEIKLDSEVKRHPGEPAVVVFGWENRFFDKFSATLSGYDFSVLPSAVTFEKKQIPKENHSFVISAREPDNSNTALMLIASDTAEALSGLCRKLPHYHKYSYLGFKGSEPENIVKGRWQALHSPMTVFIQDENGKIQKVEMGKLNKRQPLVTMQSDFSGERMMDTIKFLSSAELKGRGSGTEEIERAAEYIANKFSGAGLVPAGEINESYFQTWKEKDGPVRKNIIGVIPGNKPDWSSQSLIIGAHYDHLGKGCKNLKESKGDTFCPGADDNASGIAVLIELARVLGKNIKPERNIVFIAFAGEEVGRKGSKYYVENYSHFPIKQSIGMLNLDTVGRLNKNKLLVIGAGSAKEWEHILRGAGYIADINIETVKEELDSSDQKSFHEAGIPAIQFFTGPHTDYHKPTDTADKINADGLVKVASAAKEIIEYLAKRETPLTATLSGISEPAEDAGSKKERKVSLGIVPDFAHQGEGCRLSGVTEGSPAEKAGLREGDIIIQINSKPVRKLKDLSDILKSLSPGDNISITFLREGTKRTVESKLIEK